MAFKEPRGPRHGHHSESLACGGDKGGELQDGFIVAFKFSTTEGVASPGLCPPRGNTGFNVHTRAARRELSERQCDDTHQISNSGPVTGFGGGVAGRHGSSPAAAV